MTTTYSDYSEVESADTPAAQPVSKPLGRMYLFLLSPTVVFAARVNQPTNPTYPVDFIPYDGVTTGAFGDIKSLQRVAIGSAPGLDDYGSGRIRTGATSTQIRVGRSSQGRLPGELDLVDNAYITVYDLLEVWARVPHIDVSDPDAPVQYKDADLDFATHGLNSPPVAKMGVPFAATIDRLTERITVAFDASDSFTTAPGATISSYLWDIADGDLIDGALDEDFVEVEFPAGFRWVSLTVTDSNGKSMIARRPVYARDPANDTTVQAWEIESHRITTQGQQIAVRILSEIDRADYPDGTLAMIWAGEPSDPGDRSHMILPCGWHDLNSDSISAGRTATLKDSVLHLVDVGGRMGSIGVFPQMIEHADTPTAWHQMDTPNMDRLIHYLIWWHSTAIQLADYTPSGTGDDYVFTAQEADGSSLWDQVTRECQQMIPDHHLVCDTLGRLAVLPDPNLQPPGERTAVVQAVVDEDEWSDIQYEYRRTPRFYWLSSSAVRAHIVATIDELDTFFAKAPGLSPGQGEGEQVIGNKLAISQLSLNTCEGNRYARLNAAISRVRIVLAGGDRLGIEPALLAWIQLTVAAANLAQRQLPFNSTRLLPWEVSIRYQHTRTGLIKTIEIVAEPEVSGTAAATYFPPQSSTNPDNGMPDDYFDDNPGSTLPPPGPPDGGLRSGQELVVLIDLQGTGNFIFRTFDFQTDSGSGGPTWEEVTLTTGEDDHFSWVVDPFSPGYIGTGQSIDGWVAGNDGIHRLTNLFGVAQAEEQRSFAVTADGAAFHWRQIQASFGQYFSTLTNNPWLICASYYGDTMGHEGTWATYSLDAGATWSDEVQISEFYNSGTPEAFAPIALWLSPRTPGFALCAAYSATGDPPTGNVYVTLDWGATWSLYASSEAPDDPDEPVPYWAVYNLDTPGDAPTIIWGREASASMLASASGAGDIDDEGSILLLLIGPQQLKKITLSGHWYVANTTSNGTFTSQDTEVDLATPLSTLGATTNFDSSTHDPPDNASAEQSFSLVWETDDPTWDAGYNDPADVEANHPVSHGQYARFQIRAAASVSLGANTATAEARIEITVIEMELQNGHTYVPPVMNQGVIDPVHRLAGGITVPWPTNEDESVIYHGALDLTMNREYRLIRVEGDTITDISPSDGSRLYGVNLGQFGVRTHDSNRQYVVMGGVGNDTSADPDDDMYAVYISDDFGDSWVEVVAPVDNTNVPAGRQGFHVAFGGDSEQILFLWGLENYISYSSNFGADVDDRSGNLSSLGLAGAIGIAGGPA